jgi:hypothetical protein
MNGARRLLLAVVPWADRSADAHCTLAVSLMLLVAGLSTPSACAQPPSKPYDLTVLVLTQASMPDQVAISYSSTIDHSRLSEAIQRLSEQAQAQMTHISISNISPGRTPGAAGTDAEFLARGLVRDSGGLPLGPIIRSLPDWSHLRLAFIVDEPYSFCGPHDATADGFVVRLTKSSKVYDYDVERMSGEAAQAAQINIGNSAQESTGRDGLPEGTLPAALIAVPTGFLFGWLLPVRRRSADRDRQQTQEGSKP